MSGLGRVKRIMARRRIKRAAMLSYRYRGSVHYTQGAARWQGISRRRRGRKGQYPNYADCSSLATWCYWDAVIDYGCRDFVNGAGWQAGFTGTMVRHGKRIPRPRNVGDLVFYGGSLSLPSHVAIYVGRGLVVSHGSERGPLLVPWNYRPVMQVRRYL